MVPFVFRVFYDRTALFFFKSIEFPFGIRNKLQIILRLQKINFCWFFSLKCHCNDLGCRLTGWEKNTKHDFTYNLIWYDLYLQFKLKSCIIVNYYWLNENLAASFIKSQNVPAHAGACDWIQRDLCWIAKRLACRTVIKWHGMDTSTRFVALKIFIYCECSRKNPLYTFEIWFVFVAQLHIGRVINNDLRSELKWPQKHRNFLFFLQLNWSEIEKSEKIEQTMRPHENRFIYKM